jgi:Flp pilus assembly protein TadG
MTRYACIDRLLSFIRGRSGSVAVMFALCIIPLVAIIGLVIDYGNALTYKARLNVAADAAALKAVTTAQAYLASTDPLIVASAQSYAETSGGKAFLANAGSAISLVTGGTSTVHVAITGGGANALTATTITATVTYQAASPNAFAQIFNRNSIALNGSAQASVTMAAYVNYYLLIDVSGSMGLPSTNTGQSALATINPDDKCDYSNGCVFACHFSGYQGYGLTRGPAVKGANKKVDCSNGTSYTAPVYSVSNPIPSTDFCLENDPRGCIQLRTDAVAYAIQQFMATALQTETRPDQIGVGLYPFITHMQQYPKAPALTTDLNAVSTNAAKVPSLLDTGTQANSAGSLGSGGTHFENALSELQPLITPIGNGSTVNSPRPFVFLITDGAEDPQYQSGGGWWGSNHATTIDTKFCDSITTSGVGLYILYIPYQPIQNPTTFSNSEDIFANANIPYIPPSLTKCASKNGFFTANTPAEITAAIQAMFAASLQSTRLTQ